MGNNFCECHWSNEEAESHILANSQKIKPMEKENIDSNNINNNNDIKSNSIIKSNRDGMTLEQNEKINKKKSYSFKDVNSVDNSNNNSGIIYINKEELNKKESEITEDFLEQMINGNINLNNISNYEINKFNEKNKDNLNSNEKDNYIYNKFEPNLNYESNYYNSNKREENRNDFLSLDEDD